MTTMAELNSTLDLATLNARFEIASPADVVGWAAETFGNQLIMSSSFGADSAVLLHLANNVSPGIRIVFVDTGYLFPETHSFMAELRQRFNLNVWSYRTKNDPIAYLQQAGEIDPTMRADVNACCGANKNEPFDRAMREIAPRGWLRGIRRNQSASRADRQFVEWSKRYNCHAISPLLNWTGREIFGYLKQHDLPHHPLVEHGYLSIGCNPLTCTRPITAGDEARAGRWTGQGKVECGINLTDSLDSSAL